MNSIRLRLTRKLLLGLVLLLGAGLLTIYLSVRAALVTEFDNALWTKALAVTTGTEQEADRFSVRFSDRFMRGFDNQVATDFFEIWGVDGTVVGRSRMIEGFDLPRRIGSFDSPKYWNFRLDSGLPVRGIGFDFTPRLAPRLPKTTPRAKLSLVVAVDRHPLIETLFKLKLIIGGCGVLLLGATVGLLRPILRTELHPLERLGEQAARITADSLATRFPVDVLPTELVPIATRLNDLLARLQESFERERRFSADLAHELRTPLAELRSLAECAIKWPDSRNPSTDEEIVAIAAHMEGMVRRMLVLAHSERGQLALCREDIAIGPMVDAVWRPLAERAEGKRLRATFAIQPAAVSADPVLLRSILANLYDNAVEYSPSGGEISTVVLPAGDRISLSITNSVEGFTEADSRKLFDRFWRKEASRTGHEHSGLGLSLAREFSRAMDFELTAAFDQGRLTFTLVGVRGSLTGLAVAESQFVI